MDCDGKPIGLTASVVGNRGGTEKPGGWRGCTREEDAGLCIVAGTVDMTWPDVNQPGTCSDEAAAGETWSE